jgi:hypothetical protein
LLIKGADAIGTVAGAIKASDKAVGMIASGIKIADDVVDTAKTAKKVSDAVQDAELAAKSIDKISDAGKSAAKVAEDLKGVAEAGNEIEKTVNLNATHKITMGKNKFNKFVDVIKKEGIHDPIKYVEYNGKKYIVDGHHRLQAAKILGIEDVPVEKVELPYAGYKNIEDLLWGD